MPWGHDQSKRRGDELTGQDSEAVRKAFLTEIMSELNLEGEALQVRKQGEAERQFRKKNSISKGPEAQNSKLSMGSLVHSPLDRQFPPNLSFHSCMIL